MELYLSDGRSVFLAFLDKKTARDAASKIAASRADIALFDRKKKLEAAKLAQERWRSRRMSTFEYLASLNALAGRTRNDLTQYPVFPWVLADYVSDTIDLTRRDQFRDLSKPIGALEPKRAKQFEERFALLAEDPESPHPPFHYGSHYPPPPPFCTSCCVWSRSPRSPDSYKEGGSTTPTACSARWRAPGRGASRARRTSRS